MGNRRRRLGLESLERRDLLAGEILISSNGGNRPSELVSLEVGIPGDSNVAGRQAASGASLSSLIGEPVHTSEISIPIRDITASKSIDGKVYTVGRGNDNLAKAHVLDLTTGGSSLISLESVDPSRSANDFAYAIGQIGGEIAFAGFSSVTATTWGLDGSATNAPVIPNWPVLAPTNHGLIRDVTRSGFMTGEQSIFAVAWNASGDVVELPGWELSNALGHSSTGIAMTDDGRLIVGGIGGRAAAWEAVGDPSAGNYVLKEYGFSSIFGYQMEAGTGGSAPEAGQYLLDTEAFGPVMFAAYQTSNGVRGGAWSVADGSFLRDFGPGRVRGVFEQDGHIIVASNDTLVEKSGALWSFTDSEPLYLRDLFPDLPYDSLYFTDGGVYQTEKGFGILLDTGTVGENVRAEFELNAGPPLYTYLVDKNGDGLIDLEQEGPATTELLLSFEESGSYNVIVQALFGGEVIAVGSTTVDITPFAPGSEAIYEVPMDINGDGMLSPMDALQVLNEIARTSPLEGESPRATAPRFDVNRDGEVTPLDALLILNRISRGGNGAEVPKVSLVNDTGLPADGLSSDISLIGSASPVGGLFVSHNGEVRDISSSRVDGVFSLPQDELKSLFGSFPDGDHEFLFWHGTENALDAAKTRVKLAYDSTPPGTFALSQPVTRTDGTRRLQWDIALGASRYQMFIQREGESDFSPLGEERQTEFLTLDLPNGTYAAYVLAWDAAGNRTESPQIQFALQ